MIEFFKKKVMVSKLLNEIEMKLINVCCELNENLNLTISANKSIFIYKSRFLKFDPESGEIIIDEPSAETPGAKPLSKGQSFEAFFEYKEFRYIFSSRVIDHTRFKLNSQGFYALKISIPTYLKDGERRDYFRVRAPLKPPITVKFTIYRKGSKEPVKSSLIKDQVEEFEGELTDISGGGIAIKGKEGDRSLSLEKGDLINARFMLKPEFGPMEIWSEVRNKRRYKETDIFIWGLQFLSQEKNKSLKSYRNKIMNYVANRQREILFN